MPIFKLRFLLFSTRESDFYNIFKNVIFRTSLAAQDLIESGYFYKIEHNTRNVKLNNNDGYKIICKKYNIEFDPFPYFENNPEILKNIALPNCVYKLSEAFYTDLKKQTINQIGEIISPERIQYSSILKVPHYLSIPKKSVINLNAASVHKILEKKH